MLELLLLRRFNKPSTYSNRPPSDHSDVIPFPSSLATLDSPFLSLSGTGTPLGSKLTALHLHVLSLTFQPPASRSTFPFQINCFTFHIRILLLLSSISASSSSSSLSSSSSSSYRHDQRHRHSITPDFQ